MKKAENRKRIKDWIDANYLNLASLYIRNKKALMLVRDCEGTEFIGVSFYHIEDFIALNGDLMTPHENEKLIGDVKRSTEGNEMPIIITDDYGWELFPCLLIF